MAKRLSRTEHRLRLSFDPDYGEKWNELIEDRKAVWRATKKTLVARSTIFLSTVLGWTAWILSQNFYVSILVPIVFMSLESIGYAYWADRKKRRELGL